MKHQKPKTAIIIGAGPAGLTAALELLEKTDVKPIVLEMSEKIGGISRTEVYKGNRIDIGGHRFFSKSERVMDWWQKILPIEPQDQPDQQKKNRMLVRSRLSRIYFLRKFFDYPVSLNTSTITNLGLWRICKIGFSYLVVRIKPIRKEKSLEDFFINRFGKELYKTFFRDYTAKVWGVSCTMIKPEWGAQRIKGISITKVIKHALSKINANDIRQKKTETSLISRFLYPKYGPGQMWEEVARIVQQKGGVIKMHQKVVGITTISDSQIETVKIIDSKTGATEILKGDYFFSTMPIKDLVIAWQSEMPKEIKQIGKGLQYRDFLTVGLLLKKLKVKNQDGTKIKDNWIYVQEPDVKVGRIQIFNNWSPYLVKDENTVWIGLEYFCNEGDDLWSMTDEKLKELAKVEMSKIDIIEQTDVLDAVVIKTPKAYPAYFGNYDSLPKVKDYLDGYENLFLIGRNGMHRYNNQDHSMLSAMTAVENVISGRKDKQNIWDVNTETEYHEEGSERKESVEDNSDKRWKEEIRDRR